MLNAYTVNVPEGQFQSGVTSNGFPRPSSAQYQGFINSLGNAGITSKMEAAMFLAQLLHEAGTICRRQNEMLSHNCHLGISMYCT
jgi:hypothetical protein